MTCPRINFNKMTATVEFTYGMRQGKLQIPYGDYDTEEEIIERTRVSVRKLYGEPYGIEKFEILSYS